MYSQVIILGNVYFCVVFRLQGAEPQIVDKYSSDTAAGVREWLAQNGYPMKGELLSQRQDANLPHMYYIKPHLTDHYFSVDENNHVHAADANHFGAVMFAYDGY